MLEEKMVKDLKILSELLDSRFKGPLNMRFGFDALIGLIPGIGDAFTTIVGVYIIARGAYLGLPLQVLLHMGLNLLIDYALGVWPVFGDIFDFYWKANNKNYKLIEKYLGQPVRVKRHSVFYLLTLGLLGALLLSLPFALFYYLFEALFSLLR